MASTASGANRTPGRQDGFADASAAWLSHIRKTGFSGRRLLGVDCHDDDFVVREDTVYGHGDSPLAHHPHRTKRIRIIRQLSQVFVFGSLIFFAARPAEAVIYTGFPENGNGPGGAWSYTHAATSSAMSPPGGWTQYASGTVLTAIDPGSTLSFDYNDFLSDGLGAGDTLVFDTQLLIRDFSGNIFGTPTLLGQIGTIDITGTLTVGGSHSSEYSDGLSGSLDFLIEYTADGKGNRKAGDTIEGTWYFQAAALTSKFNGIRDDIEFALWGDNRSATGALPAGTLYKENGDIVENYALGIDLVVNAAPEGPDDMVPEPSSLVVWSILGCVAGFWTWRRRRKNAT